MKLDANHTIHISMSNIASNLPKLISIPSVRNIPSGRIHRAIQTLNNDAASPNRGASVEEINQVDPPPEGVIPKDSFVWYIITYNQEAYNKMLDNKFCQDMCNASTDDEVANVRKGYKWYTVQDFKYCEGLMRYDAARAANAPTTEEVLAGADDIKSGKEFADSVLDACVQLGIPKAKVFSAKKELAAQSYTQFEVQSAKEEDWVTSKVAMIPCIQGYYEIAGKMITNSKRKDTDWYTGWVLPNHEWKYCAKQIQFFEANAKDWRNATPSVQEKWHKIFKKACQHEVDFFAIGENPEDV